MAPCSQALSALPATRSPKPHGWMPGPTTGSASPIPWTRTGSPRPSCPFKSSSCAARDEPLALSVARSEAVRLAKHISGLDADIKANSSRITELVEISEAAPLLQETGFGPVTAAICLTAWFHQGRVRSEAAFASVAGANPVPASSGNTVRHRLNRGGDRTLNKALHMVPLSRMAFDAQTIGYVEKRQAEGRTKKEIRRCVKRYLARRIYRTLNATNPAPSQA